LAGARDRPSSLPCSRWQAPNALKLASFTGPGTQGGGHTGREIVLGAGAGLLVLALGVFGGVLIGRRRVA